MTDPLLGYEPTGEIRWMDGVGYMRYCNYHMGVEKWVKIMSLGEAANDSVSP